jgi:Divalent cation transporter
MGFVGRGQLRRNLRHKRRKTSSGAEIYARAFGAQKRRTLRPLRPTVLAGVVALWFQNGLLALVIPLAVLINFACAGLAGILVPLTLRRIRTDPAVSSSVFVTFVTDIIGFMAFLASRRSCCWAARAANNHQALAPPSSRTRGWPAVACRAKEGARPG